MPRRVVLPYEETGDRRQDATARRVRDSLAAEDTTPTTVAGGDDGAATLTAERADWTASGASVVSYLETVETTDATATTLASHAMAEAHSCRLTAVVIGRRKGNGDTYSAAIEATYQRAASTPTVVGTTSPSPHASAGASTWLVQFDALDDKVRLRVTGQASATIAWSAELRVQEIA